MVKNNISKAEKRMATVYALVRDIYHLVEEKDRFRNDPDKEMLVRLERYLQSSEAALLELVGAEEYEKLTGQKL